MANIDEAFPSNYLKASDLKGQQPIVSIDRVEFEPVGRAKEMKPILYFEGKDKGLVLNKTNSNNIKGLAGSSETDEWTGLRVRLYSTHVEFNGESVEAIRVKAAPPSGAAPRATRQAPPPVDTEPMEPITDDEIPF